MNYTSIEIDTELLETVEGKTDSFKERDEWIEDAIGHYLQRDDLPERPNLNRDEYRAWLVENAIRTRLEQPISSEPR